MPIVNAPQLASSQASKNTSDVPESISSNLTGSTTANSVITDMDLHTRKQNNLGKKGLKVKRFYTREGKDPYFGIKFATRTSKITNPDGSVVFEMKNVEVPETWSQVAVDILAQKYFRKKGVPQFNEDGTPKLDEHGKQILGGETSAKQSMHRLAGTWRSWGEKYNYFDSKADADAFEAEVKYMLMDQIAVPNSPQWFNTGLHWAYGITGEAQGHYYVDPATGQLKKSTDAYSRPQPHACFIQEVKDDLVNEGGIFDLVTKEARLFKYGSGTGTNFSKVRGKGEKLSGGGTSSGLMSFLKVLDVGAGAIQSGGTTRRAAKMVTLDVDHPEIMEFIDWKVREEQKVLDLVTGSHLNAKHLKDIMQLAEDGGIDPEKNKPLKHAIMKANALGIALNYVKRVLMLVENGVKTSEFNFDTFDTDFRSEAYYTVSGQNSNNSVRVTNEFLEAVNDDKDWNLIRRTDGSVHKTLKARDVWDKINYAAWNSADPGIQYHTTINEWHTSPAEGEIVGSNPCSEYMFLDETACNLYQINLIKFYDSETGVFDTEAFAHCVRLSTIILEISVLMSQLPSSTMAVGTYNYRTLGLGYANVGTLLMQMGYPYDSEEGFAVTGAVTAIMGGEAYATSAEMAAVQGAFGKYEMNKQSMLRVIRNHRRAAYSADESEYEGLTIKPFKLRSELLPNNLVEAAKSSWDYALSLGEEYGYRNAQVTCIAPTGTSGLVMDCDTTGIEPDFALVKFKKLVGGGYFKIINQSIEPALRNLGYPEAQIKSIVEYAVGKQSLDGAPHINAETLAAKGFTAEKIASVEAVLPTVFELKYAFSKWTLGEDFCKDVLGISQTELADPSFNLLNSLGFTDAQIKEAGEYVCGSMTVEGAPYLKQEHYAVFDCANKCGEKGTRYISHLGHIKQMAAAQPFISGAISKTINMPEEATIDDVADAYMQSWHLMIKASALYRDGSKLSQPLSTSSDSGSVYAKLFDFENEVDTLEVEPQRVQEIIYKEVEKPVRRKLPVERHSITHKFEVAGHEAYITVGLYEDGAPGEIFLSINKEGSTLSGIMDALATSLSINLQYGVPVENIIKKLVHTRFEPNGFTTNPEIPVVKSILDYIGRWLSIKFLDKEKAKQYHTVELVEKAYAPGGSNQRLEIPVQNAQKLDASSKSSLIKFNSTPKQTKTEPETEKTVVVYNTAVRSEHRANEPVATSGVPISQTAQPEATEKAENNAATTPTVASNGEVSDLEKFSQMQQQLAYTQNNEDAPLCTTCGSITIRNGACYKCVNCGSTTGCS